MSFVPFENSACLLKKVHLLREKKWGFSKLAAKQVPPPFFSYFPTHIT